MPCAGVVGWRAPLCMFSHYTVDSTSSFDVAIISHQSSVRRMPPRGMPKVVSIVFRAITVCLILASW